MQLEYISVEPPVSEWIPGVGDVAVYDGAISVGPQYLALDDRNDQSVN